MVYCYVCGRDIGYLAWGRHTKMEKRIHGDDIYVRLKAQREGREFRTKCNLDNWVIKHD